MTAQHQDASPARPRRGRPPTVAVDDIVGVALELFGTRGLRGTSIAAVAERLGITDGGVLHHFPTKGALIEAVLDRAAQFQVAQMRELVAPGGLTAIKNMSAWGAVVSQTPELAAFGAVLSTEALLDDSLVRGQVLRRYDAIHDLTTGLIGQGIERGEIRPDVDAEWEARALVAFLDGVRLQWLYSERQLPLADIVSRYFDLLVERLTRDPSGGGCAAWPPPDA